MMRPSSYGEKVIALAEDYLENYNSKYGDVVPMVVGLCKAINRSKSIVYAWCKDEDKKEFLDIVNAIGELQEGKLINGTLTKEFEPRTANMMLSKYGYSTKVENDHTSSDGSMTPERSTIDDFYADTKSES